jgi:hypothetical protein
MPAVEFFVDGSRRRDYGSALLTESGVAGRTPPDGVYAADFAGLNALLEVVPL